MTHGSALLTTAEVAAVLRVHPNTVYRLVTAGELIAARVGGKGLRFTRADLDAYVERKRDVPAVARGRVPNTPSVVLPQGMALDDVNPITGRRVRDDLAAWGY